MNPKILPRAKILQSTAADKQLFVDPGNSDELIPISIPVIDYTKLGVPVLDFTETISVSVDCDTTEVRAALSQGLVKTLIKVKIGASTILDASIVACPMHAVQPDGTDMYQYITWAVFKSLACIMVVVTNDSITFQQLI